MVGRERREGRRGGGGRGAYLMVSMVVVCLMICD